MQNIDNKLQLTNIVEVKESYSRKEIRTRINMLKDQKAVINAELDKWQALEQQAIDLGVTEEVEVVEPLEEII